MAAVGHQAVLMLAMVVVMVVTDKVLVHTKIAAAGVLVDIPEMVVMVRLVTLAKLEMVKAVAVGDQWQTTADILVEVVVLVSMVKARMVLVV